MDTWVVNLGLGVLKGADPHPIHPLLTVNLDQVGDLFLVVDLLQDACNHFHSQVGTFQAVGQQDWEKASLQGLKAAFVKVAIVKVALVGVALLKVHQNVDHKQLKVRK